ncbi:MAG: 2-succinyl-5-enolpyruvyl-6-hydroxy-3-cyclohexene-1-carboxylic-acid synthase [Actinobacteria bacterium]|nr:2-succinyl-5-enolpyruvyl-6-hydroxy-3-cyclohexene-1-carboxylic-acid synthase [Actinomycetota bacterium]
MELTNETFAPLRVLIDELARCGVRHAVAAPGSRNAPITYCLADRDDIKTWTVLDERSAGFFALGLAKSTGEPVVVTCSSGTAAANLHPAVIEADHAGVPLIVLTADRPPELRDVGAGQAIDQIKLFGSSVRWFVEAGNHPLGEQTLRHFRALGCRVVAEATGSNPGPIHVNLPLREPLAPAPQELGELEASEAAGGRAGGAPWTAPSRPERTGALPDELAAAKRPLIVVGEQNTPGLAEAIATYSERTGTPVLADALSQLRRERFAGQSAIVCAYDLILRDAVVREHLAPDFVLRIGETPTSKPLRSWLEGLACPQVVMDPRGVWHDPTRTAARISSHDPLAAFTIADGTASRASAAPSWSSAWEVIERAAQTAAGNALSAEPFPFEPAIYRSVLNGLDAGATVFVSSSMPIRDVESYAPPGRFDVRYLANRGANGIDGVISSALGAAAPFNCDRVILFTGDLALLYDASALGAAKQLGIEITIVCVDNDGGGIFSFLPIAEHASHFEQRIAAPSGADIEAIVKAYGWDYSSPTDPAALNTAAARPGVVHLRTERAANKTAHDRVVAHVIDAVSAALTETGALH